MLLNEFFGKAINLGHTADKDKDKHGKLADDAFWFILDHDRIHKEHFHTLAPKIKKSHSNSDADKEKLVKEFMPMVERGCKEYYVNNKMKGKLGKLFPKEMRKDMCERLYDHYCEDIVKDSYKIGG
jgi:hypothetical protein